MSLFKIKNIKFLVKKMDLADETITISHEFYIRNGYLALVIKTNPLAIETTN